MASSGSRETSVQHSRPRPPPRCGVSSLIAPPKPASTQSKAIPNDDVRKSVDDHPSAGRPRLSNHGGEASLGKPVAVMAGKGVFIGAGATGIAQLTRTGVVIKTPWKGKDRAEKCRNDMITEMRIYQRVGPHPRLIRMLDWDPEDCSLTLENMANGSLREYLRANFKSISLHQRLIWAKQAADAVHVLHSADVIHCDVSPRNFLLGDDLDLRIADFGGSSLQGSKASACAPVRYTKPGLDWRAPPMIEDDIFSLGSMIYLLVTGQPPFHDLSSAEVESRFAARSFPDATGLPCGHVIRTCWARSMASAQAVADLLTSEL